MKKILIFSLLLCSGPAFSANSSEKASSSNKPAVDETRIIKHAGGASGDDYSIHIQVNKSNLEKARLLLDIMLGSAVAAAGGIAGASLAQAVMHNEISLITSAAWGAGAASLNLIFDSCKALFHKK